MGERGKLPDGNGKPKDSYCDNFFRVIKYYNFPTQSEIIQYKNNHHSSFSSNTHRNHTRISQQAAMELPNAKKFFDQIQKRIYGIFGRKVGATGTPLKEQFLPKYKRGPHRRLPLEMECEIFKCLKLPTQRKFIRGIGKGIYQMFGHKLLTKTKRLCNPTRNEWDANVQDEIQPFHREYKWKNVYAKKGFPISVELCRKKDNSFPGTILYYYEVINKSYKYWPRFFVGLSGANDGSSNIGYVIVNEGGYFFLSDEEDAIEMPNEERINPKWNGPGDEYGDVVGSGLLLSPANELAIFFTLNGTLLGKQIPIDNSGCSCLFPVVRIYNVSLVANFGDDQDKPFKFDIQNCPGLV